MESKQDADMDSQSTTPMNLDLLNYVEDREIVNQFENRKFLAFLHLPLTISDDQCIDI